MHRCVISTMFGWCFWFFKKTFLLKQPLVPPPASAVLYIFPIAAKHRFPLDHTGPEWFSTHRRTIHPLDAWTCCGWTWTSPVPSPPSQTDQVNLYIWLRGNKSEGTLLLYLHTVPTGFKENRGIFIVESALKISFMPGKVPSPRCNLHLLVAHNPTNVMNISKNEQYNISQGCRIRNTVDTTLLFHLSP